MNLAHLARLRSLETQLAPRRRDDTEDRQRLINEILEEVERHVEQDQPEPSEAEIAAIEAILEERVAARGHGR